MKIIVRFPDGHETEYDLSDETVAALQQIAARNSITFAAAVEQAIANENFIEDQRSSGGRVLILKDDELREVEFGAPVAV